jgi:hypothetical protein
MAQFYGVAIMPARPYKPRDKAKVEAAVLLSERWLIAVLRHDKFFSLADLNQAIAKLLERMNQRPFRKRGRESGLALCRPGSTLGRGLTSSRRKLARQAKRGVKCLRGQCEDIESR